MVMLSKKGLNTTWDIPPFLAESPLWTFVQLLGITQW